MPITFIPSAVGDELIIVGQKQIDTGNKLKSSSVHLRTTSSALNERGQIVSTISALQNGATSVRDLLSPVVTALTFISNALGGIAIPTVTPTFTNILNIRVVTGLQFGSTKPFSTSATRFATMATNVTSIRNTLKTVAVSLGTLLTQMPIIQTNINNSATEMNIAGDEIIASGTALKNAGMLLKV